MKKRKKREKQYVAVQLNAEVMRTYNAFRDQIIHLVLRAYLNGREDGERARRKKR